MRVRQLAQAASRAVLGSGGRGAPLDEPSANLRKVVCTSLDPGGRNPANLPVSGWWPRKSLRMPIGNSNVQGTTCWPGDHLRQICISASAAGNPPMGGILASVIPGGHGFGGRRLPMALLAPPDMQICTSEIAAGAGPRVGAQNCASLCRWPTDKSANWRICGQGRLRLVVGKCANLRNYSAWGISGTSAHAEVRVQCLWV